MTSSVKRPLVFAAFGWASVLVVMAVAYWLPAARWADGWAVEGFLNLQRPWLSDAAHFIARLADPGPYAVWTALVAAVALYRRRPRHALAVILLVGSANVLSQLLKVLLAHPRHHDFLGGAQLADAAFPSGHATASMTLVFAAVLVAPAALRPIVAIVGAIFAVAVSESILLLAWHFPSDVVGGFLVATASTLMAVAALRAADHRWPQRTGREAARRAIGAVDMRRAGIGIAALAVLAFLVAVLVTGGDSLRYADRHTAAVLAAAAVAVLAVALPVAVTTLGDRRN